VSPSRGGADAAGRGAVHLLLEAGFGTAAYAGARERAPAALRVAPPPRRGAGAPGATAGTAAPGRGGLPSFGALLRAGGGGGGAALGAIATEEEALGAATEEEPPPPPPPSY